MNDTATQAPLDLLALSKAPMGDLLAALKDERTLSDQGGAVPPRALQVARLITAEAVRLIRLGTRPELVDVSVEIAQALVRQPLRDLAEHQAEAYRLVSGASVVIGAATSPASSGGELAVLRSWSGKAREAVALVNGAEEKSMQRTELRSMLGVEESYLSHLLADLEAAGLVERIRNGRTVTVRLGPTGRADHVQELLPSFEDPMLIAEREAYVRRVRERLIAHSVELNFITHSMADRTPSQFDEENPSTTEHLRVIAAEDTWVVDPHEGMLVDDRQRTPSGQRLVSLGQATKFGKLTESFAKDALAAADEQAA